MEQNTWEEINDAIQMEETTRADALRSLINKNNVVKCTKFYNSALNDKQKRMVIEIFCADRITDATVTVSKAFLVDTPDASTSAMDMTNYARSLAVCQLEGSFKNSDKYMGDLELRRNAEKRILEA